MMMNLTAVAIATAALHGNDRRKNTLHLCFATENIFQECFTYVTPG